MKAISIALLLVLGSALAGCVGDMNDRTIDALIGQSREELVQCAGAPSAELNAINRQFMTYKATVGPTRFQYTTWCVLTFTVQGGQITRWKGDWDGPLNDNMAACQQILSSCIVS